MFMCAHAMGVLMKALAGRWAPFSVSLSLLPSGQVLPPNVELGWQAPVTLLFPPFTNLGLRRAQPHPAFYMGVVI